jgi:hypothetical protein
VLATFLLSLGVAMASPVFKSDTLAQVCSSAGTAYVLVHGDGDGDVQGMDAGGMDCPLCPAGGAPPSSLHILNGGPAAQPCGRIVAAIPAARLAAVVSAPLPPRGPPAHA